VVAYRRHDGAGTRARHVRGDYVAEDYALADRLVQIERRFDR
jgi:hypothetical protein